MLQPLHLQLQLLHGTCVRYGSNARKVRLIRKESVFDTELQLLQGKYVAEVLVGLGADTHSLLILAGGSA